MPQTKPYLFLVAESDDDRILFLKCLGESNPEVPVKSSKNGHHAFAYLASCSKEELPALVILDHDMPYLNGAEMLRQLAAIPALSPVPIVVWSRWMHLYWRCKSLGATEFFVKAGSNDEMKAIVKRIIEIMHNRLA